MHTIFVGGSHDDHTYMYYIFRWITRMTGKQLIQNNKQTSTHTFVHLILNTLHFNHIIT